ncbi:MAG: rhodanese-like domain-containing protein [Bacteroidia bacterium]|nr:rhodanese-like domain-containing protein [Bacteroidia bacterium]NNL81750.1 rhodanese-like domain-containing protein [Winogradskyella sp.]
MKKLLGITLALFVFLTTSCNDQSKDTNTLITADEMLDILQIEDAQLVDVRTPEEFNKAHIKDAQNIDYNSPTFDEDISKIDKTKPVIVYCKSGNRSAKCSKKLQKAGFTKVYDLQGGISKWKYHKDIVIVSSP